PAPHGRPVPPGGRGGPAGAAGRRAGPDALRGADHRLDGRAGGRQRRGDAEDRPGDLQPPGGRRAARRRRHELLREGRVPLPAHDGGARGQHALRHQAPGRPAADADRLAWAGQHRGGAGAGRGRLEVVRARRHQGRRVPLLHERLLGLPGGQGPLQGRGPLLADVVGGPVTGRTRVAAVIGSPVRHSLSPTIHNAAFAATGLDWVYVAFEVPEGRGGDAVAAVRTLGLAGLSVTMPHKAAVHDAVDERTPVAAALGAVNCVYWRGDRLVGDNTDGAGFLDALRADEGVEVGGRRCVVVGAGGAGRAVAHALGGAGAAEVVVVNRSPGPAARAAELAGAA